MLVQSRSFAGRGSVWVGEEHRALGRNPRLCPPQLGDLDQVTDPRCAPVSSYDKGHARICLI